MLHKVVISDHLKFSLSQNFTKIINNFVCVCVFLMDWILLKLDTHTLSLSQH